jgi:hypothetical protein
MGFDTVKLHRLAFASVASAGTDTTFASGRLDTMASNFSALRPEITIPAFRALQITLVPTFRLTLCTFRGKTWGWLELVVDTDRRTTT